MSVTLTTVSSGYNLSAINANFQSLQTVLNDNILWRTGSVSGESKMSRDLDMDGHLILNVGTDPNSPDSLLTVGQADARYYNVAGDVLEAPLDAGGFTLSNLGLPSSPTDAARKGELDSEISARQHADANLQSQMTGNIPLEASAFSEISWHDQQIDNSVDIPANKNAWSFGPQMEIEAGQAVTVGEGSSWTIANGRVVEDEDLHSLIADRLTTVDGGTIVNVDEIATDVDISSLSSQISSLNSNLSSIATRMSAEESKVQSIALGGTGAITATAARSNLGLLDMATQAPSAVAITGGTISGITGTTAGTEAAAGTVGQVVTSSASSVSLTNAVFSNITSISLTAGDWEITGVVEYSPSAASPTRMSTAITSTSAAVDNWFNRTLLRATMTAAGQQCQTTPVVRYNLTSTTTVYLVGLMDFSTGTCTAQGYIRARRIR